MNREAFLKPAVKTQPVILPDGTAAAVRKLSQGEVEKSRQIAKDKGDFAAARYIVCRATVNDDGSRVFADADEAELANADHEAMEAIALQVVTFTGLVKPKNP